MTRTHRFPLAPAFVATSILALASLGGCSGTEAVGRAEMVALGSAPLLFEREFIVGSYATKESEDSFWFSDVPLSRLIAHSEESPLKDAVFLHAQMIWIPKPGLTPLDPSATNLVLRVLIVSDGEVGLYGGAGFARVEGEPGDERIEIEAEGGTLTLLERTKGFNDLMSPAGFSGTFAARFAPEDAARWRRALSQFATNAFGKSMWVSDQDPRAALEALARR
jgi:hypothetical protein